MKSIITPYPLYDLSNTHFQNLEIITKANKSIKGQFVQFKVVKGIVEYLYPAEKFCFLSAENKKEFWNAYNLNNGEFKELPKYIKQLYLTDIIKIIIEPLLAV
ncbi:MAG: hypothetical protein WCH21_09410 [Bacteroidota bacterium]